MPASGATQINADYLNGLKGQLQTVLDNVNTQLKGVGSSPAGWVNPVDQNFSVLDGPNGFNAGAQLNAALKKMGGSVNQQLTWLQKVLTDMINEITNTVNSFKGTESLNTESVNQLLTDFQSTIKDVNNPPSSAGTPSGNSTPPPSSTPAPGGN
jgi:hypothetical protein